MCIWGDPCPCLVNQKSLPAAESITYPSKYPPGFPVPTPAHPSPLKLCQSVNRIQHTESLALAGHPLPADKTTAFRCKVTYPSEGSDAVFVGVFMGEGCDKKMISNTGLYEEEDSYSDEDDFEDDGLDSVDGGEVKEKVVRAVWDDPRCFGWVIPSPHIFKTPNPPLALPQPVVEGKEMEMNVDDLTSTSSDVPSRVDARIHRVCASGCSYMYEDIEGLQSDESVWSEIAVCEYDPLQQTLILTHSRFPAAKFTMNLQDFVSHHLSRQIHNTCMHTQ